MAETIGELAVELGIFADIKEANAFQKKLSQLAQGMEQTAKKAKKTNTNIKSLVKGLAGVATAIGGAVLAISKLTDSLVASNQEFLNLTRTSDIALGTFQKWNAVGRMFGVRNAAQQLENLNQKLFELKLTGQGAEGFMLAGINPMGQDANGVMEQLRSRVAGLDDTAAAYLLRQMGLDPSMLHLLRMGREEFEELGKTIEKYQLTEDQRKDIQAMNVQLEIARIKLQYLKDRAVLKLMPILVKLMDSFARVTEGIARFADLISKSEAACVALGIVITATLIPAIKRLFALLTAHPVMAALTAILGLLYLIVDDVMTYFQGGRSGIGYLLYFLDEMNEKLNSIETPKWIQDLVYLVQNIGHLGNAISDIKSGSVNADVGKAAYNLMKITNPFMWGMPDYYKFHNSLISPQTNQNIDNSKHTRNQNKTINMNNTIHTSQAGVTVLDELAYIQNTAYSYL